MKEKVFVTFSTVSRIPGAGGAVEPSLEVAARNMQSKQGRERRRFALLRLQERPGQAVRRWRRAPLHVSRIKV